MAHDKDAVNSFDKTLALAKKNSEEFMDTPVNIMGNYHMPGRGSMQTPREFQAKMGEMRAARSAPGYYRKSGISEGSYASPAYIENVKEKKAEKLQAGGPIQKGYVLPRELAHLAGDKINVGRSGIDEVPVGMTSGGKLALAMRGESISRGSEADLAKMIHESAGSVGFMKGGSLNDSIHGVNVSSSEKPNPQQNVRIKVETGHELGEAFAFKDHKYGSKYLS